MGLQPLLWSDFAPDLDSITSGACTDMSNVYPTQSGFYRTMPGLQLVGTGLTGTVLGGYSGLLIDKQLTFAATQNQLWIWNSGIFLSSNAALILNQNRRRFAVYGNLIIVVDGVNVPYYYSTGFAAPAFVPLPGWPGAFGPVNPSIVETTDYATILVQANSQVLWSSLVPQGPYIPSVPAQVYQYNLGNITGDITAVHRLRNLLVVYRQNAFQCATFVGVDIGWDFGSPGTISEDIGAAGNECVINTGDYHYIWGPDDFWQFDGYNLNRIPNNLKQFIFRDLDQAFFANVAGRYDVNRTLVFWHYPSINAKPRGSLDSYVSLNLRTGKWGFGRLAIDLPLTGLMNNPVDSQHTPDTGVFLTDHNLYLYDENAQFSPQPTPPSTSSTAPFLIAAGINNLIVTSTDGGNTWRVAHADDGSNSPLSYGAWNGASAYVLASNHNAIGDGLWSSIDGGVTWAKIAIPVGLHFGVASALGSLNILQTVIWDGKQFLCVGWVTVSGDYVQGKIGSSPDGVTWTFRNLGVAGSGNHTGLIIAVAYNGARYVALEWNVSLAQPNGFYTSTDAIAWALSFTAAVEQEYSWLGTNPAGQFLAVASDSGAPPPNNTAYIATSTNGLAWTEQVNGVRAIQEHGNVFWDMVSSQWIIAGTNNVFDAATLTFHAVIATSPDGTTWTTRLDLGPGQSQYFGTVLRGANGNLYAWLSSSNNPAGSPPYGNNGQPYVSINNGVTWTAVTAPIPDVIPGHIVWTNTQFVSLNIEGAPDFSTDDFLATSPDGITWTNRYDDAAFDLITLMGFSTSTTTPGFSFAPSTYIVSNDFGDRQMVYSMRRARPGFALYPTVPNTTPTPVLITPLIQMTNTGIPPVPTPTTGVPIAPSGFADFKVTGRLTRLRLDLYGTCELAAGNVDIAPTGAI